MIMELWLIYDHNSMIINIDSTGGSSSAQQTCPTNLGRGRPARSSLL
jgi:hypothetical protein